MSTSFPVLRDGGTVAFRILLDVYLYSAVALGGAVRLQTVSEFSALRDGGTATFSPLSGWTLLVCRQSWFCCENYPRSESEGLSALSRDIHGPNAESARPYGEGDGKLDGNHG